MTETLWDMTAPGCRNLRFALRRAAALYGDKAAYEYFDEEGGHHSRSFNRLLAESEALGTALLHRGFGGAHIAVCGGNSYEWALSYMTVLCGLGAAVPMSGEESPEGLSYLTAKGEVTVALADDAICGSFPQTVKTFGLQTELPALIEEGRALLESGDDSFTTLPIDEEALCEILFTSGTTGARRGVSLCSRNIMSIVACDFPKLIGERTLSVLPFSHGFEAVCHLLAALNPGATLCIARSGRRFARDLLEFDVDSAYVVPLQAEALLGPFAPILAQAKRLRVLVCGGAVLPEAVDRKLGSLGIKLLHGYGLSECSPLVTLNTDDTFGSVGKAAEYCQIRISGKDAEGIGDIETTGSNVMSGYYKDEQSTADAFTADGWLRTGDMGRIDEAGNLFITGRKKNVIILKNGENVMPEELEALIGEAVPRGVELRVRELEGVLAVEGFAPDTDPKELYAALRQAVERANTKVPPYKRINRILVLDAPLPRTALGKIVRH